MTIAVGSVMALISCDTKTTIPKKPNCTHVTHLTDFEPSQSVATEVSDVGDEDPTLSASTSPGPEQTDISGTSLGSVLDIFRMYVMTGRTLLLGYPRDVNVEDGLPGPNLMTPYSSS